MRDNIESFNEQRIAAFYVFEKNNTPYTIYQCLCLLL